MKKLLFVLCFGCLTATASAGEYLIGSGMYDITGPAAEVGMMGYSTLDQKTSGINMRLRSRAYVISETSGGKKIAFVCADLGMIFQAVKQQVVEKLLLDPTLGGSYDETNVLLSATHTHSGPGGYSHYLAYDAAMLGFIENNFNVIVDGIYRSIVTAHNNLTPGRIQIAEDDLAECGWQRSYNAYLNNPAEERAQFEDTTDKKMTLLKLVSDAGEEIGLISWYAVHPTNLGNTNTLISGDNKGYAQYLFEKMKGTDYSATTQQTFVASFPQANGGDVSPNVLWGYPDGVNDDKHMRYIGQLQFDKAEILYNNATEYLGGGIDYRHSHVNFDEKPIDPSWVGGQTGISTCSAAIGFAQTAGSTEDGTGLDIMYEGMVWGEISWPAITLVPDLQECQEEKAIMFPAGDMSPYPWIPEVLPLQIVKIGNLAIVAVPGEVTTMAGRRIRQTVKDQLGSSVDHIVISAVSNAYCSYLTTREEYAMQHYEGGSNMFGPYALNAFMQEYDRIAEDLKNGTTSDPGPTPRDLQNDLVNFQTGVVFDGKYLFQQFGDVETDANASYNTTETVTVQFVGGHPKNNLMTQKTFLKVEKMVNSSVMESVAANDWDPETIYQWEREGTDRSNVIIKWTIPEETSPGLYRIRHIGHWKNGWTGKVKEYQGVSRVFSVN